MRLLPVPRLITFRVCRSAWSARSLAQNRHRIRPGVVFSDMSRLLKFAHCIVQRDALRLSYRMANVPVTGMRIEAAFAWIGSAGPEAVRRHEFFR
jgi:hypothetical protein